MKKEESLKIITDDFIEKGKYVEFRVYPEIEMRVYKNQYTIDVTDFDCRNESVSKIKNWKNMETTLEQLKILYAGYYNQKQNSCCHLTDEQKRQMQEMRLDSILCK